MIRRPGAFAARRRLWGSALAFFLFGVAVYVVCQISLGDRVGYLEGRQKAARAARERAAEEARRAAGELGRLRQSEQEVREMLDARLGSYEERLTKVIAEVRALTAKSNLKLHSVSYPREEIEELDLVGVGFDFGVEGSFEDLRTFLHLVELSDYFLVVDDVSLAESSATSLALKVHIVTYLRPPPGYSRERG